MVTRVTNGIGHSGWHGSKPAGEKQVNIPTLEGKVRYLVIGEGIRRETVIYLFPHEVADKIRKYRKAGQRLIGPGINVTAEPSETEEVEVGEISQEAIIPGPISKHARPVVCMSTGQFYESAKEAGEKMDITYQLIGFACRGSLKTARGHFFRFATPKEIELRKFIGEVVPAGKPNVRSIAKFKQSKTKESH